MTAAIRLLVVDDDPLQVELVRRGLERDGFEVRGVTRFADMASAAREFEPGVVLLDVNLPDAPETNMIGEVRDAAPGARVIVYSAWEDAKLRVLVPGARIAICEEFRTPDRLAVQLFWTYFLIGVDGCVSRLREIEWYGDALAALGFADIAVIRGPFDIVVAVRA
jgi:CheY-like chemotaxis protein